MKRPRVVIIDPRRTVTVNACEDAAGKANVLHLALESGTDLILFNALMTEIAAKGWIDRDFIGKSTTGFDEMLAANKVGIDEAARVTGPQTRRYPQGGELDRRAQTGRRSTADDVRL